jgi:hypothetical protein
MVRRTKCKSSTTSTAKQNEAIGRGITGPLFVRWCAGCPGSPQEGPALFPVALALREAKQRGRGLWTHRVNHGDGGYAGIFADFRRFWLWLRR